MEWESEIKDSEFIPQKRKPTEETVKPPNDKQDKCAIIGLALLFVGRSLQEE